MSGDGSVVLIAGVMAAGKSTVAQLLAETFDRSVHVRGDLFRRMIVRGNAMPNTDAFQDELRLRYQLAAQAADNYAARGYTVVWQDCVIGAYLGEVANWVTTRPFDIYVLTARSDVIAHRDAHRHKRGYDGDWTVEQLAAILHDETPRVGTWIDNSDQSPAETVAAILAAHRT